MSALSRTCAITLMLLAAAPVPRADACSMPYIDVFTQADRATHVVIGRPVPGGIRVQRRLTRGRSRARLRIFDWQGNPRRWTTCVPPLHPNHRTLVFVGGDHRFVANYQSAIEAPRRGEAFDRARDFDVLALALTRFLRAGTDRARAEVLTDLIAGRDERLANEAAHHLLNRVQLMALVNDAARARMRTALALRDGRLGRLSLLLARLGDATSLPVMVSMLGPDGPVDRQLELAISILTNHQRRSVPWIDELLSEPRAIVSPRETWEIYLNTHPDAGFASGFRERNLPVPTTREELASVIETGPDSLSRVVALERCEQLVGHSLEDFGRYSRGLSPPFWRAVSDACRSGEPAHGW